MSPDELKALVDVGGVAIVFAFFALAMVRFMIKNHRDDMRVLMAFLRDERTQREKVMKEATAALKQLTDIIEGRD